MIEVVFSYTLKGSMIETKKYIKDQISSPETRLIEPISTNPSDIICLYLNLDIGDISGKITGEERKKIIYDMLWTPFEKDEELEKTWQDNKDSLERLVESAKSGKSIRIWWSDTPYEACGFYFINSYLNNFDCDIYGIKLPPYVANSDGTIELCIGWGQFHPYKLLDFLEVEETISKIESTIFAMEWDELKTDTSPIRAMINGKLVGVPEDFYDYFIRKYIPNKEITVARLIGNIMGRSRLTINEWWIEQRINKMIECNEIQVVTDNEINYKKVVKKVNNL